MDFYLREYKSNWKYTLGNEKNPCIFLIQDSRDDYGFHASFNCYYLKSPSTELVNLWYIRIIQKWKKSTKLPEKFEELKKDEYFSRAISWEFYKNLDDKFPEEKENILKWLQDVCYLGYNKTYIEKLKDPILIEWYNYALYRDNYYWISSNYLEEAKDTINKILFLSTSASDKFLHLLLYGSIVATLESYLWDKFKSEVMVTDENITKFIVNHERKYNKYKELFKKLYSEESWLIINASIKDYIKKEMEQIIFHKLDLVKDLFEKVLWISVPEEILSFKEDIQNRHDIFHRNGKKATWWELQIDNKIIQDLWMRVLSFINNMEEAIIAQRKIIKHIESFI